MLALHEPLHRERRHDVHGLPGVVTFAVSGRALDHRVVIRDAGLLRSLRDAVDIGTERDHRLAGSPGGHPGGGNPGDAALNVESLGFENSGEVLRGFEFLEAELGEAEDGVHHDLHLIAHAFHLAGEVGLHGFFLGRVDSGGDQRAGECSG